MKYKFSLIEKYIVWITHDKKCYWCGEPLSFKTQSIDHLIPECFEDNLEQIISDYSLPSNFVINGFCNWVPAHNNCNSKKGFQLFTLSPVFLAILNDVVKKSIPAQNSYIKLKQESKAEETLIKLLVLVEEDKISDRIIIEKLGYIMFEDKKIKDLGLQIPKCWKVESYDPIKNIVTVFNGVQYAKTIVPPEGDYNPWWYCCNCDSYGPWSGSKCLGCGYLNDPND